MTEKVRIGVQETSSGRPPSPAFIQLREVSGQLPENEIRDPHGTQRRKILPDGTVLEIDHWITSIIDKDIHSELSREDPERLIVRVKKADGQGLVSYTLKPDGELTWLDYKPGFRPSTLGLSVDHIVFSLPASLRKRLYKEPQYPQMVQKLVDWTQRLATADSLEAAGLPFQSPVVGQ